MCCPCFSIFGLAWLIRTSNEKDCGFGTSWFLPRGGGGETIRDGFGWIGGWEVLLANTSVGGGIGFFLLLGIVGLLSFYWGYPFFLLLGIVGSIIYGEGLSGG